METTLTNFFDSNQYYRIINLALGPEVSLDVANPQTTAPNGTLDIKPSGPFSGQIWQFLESSDAAGHFYISSSFLGAKLKLDVLPNSRGDYEPHLRDFTTEYNQTWKLTPHVDEVAGNKTTWTMQPDFLAVGFAGTVFSLYNDTFEPYLAPLAPEDQANSVDKFQRWSVMMEGVTVDDPTFSATHLPALATEPAVAPDGTSTDMPTATVTPTPTGQSSSSNDSHLTGPVIAAAVVPTTVFALIVAAFCLFIYMRRRQLRKLDENSPYSQSPPGSKTHAESSIIMSEIFDTVVEDPIDRWKRGNATKPQGLTSMSLLSSNLSASLWSFRNPQGSNTTVVANALSAPPHSRPQRGHNGNMGDVASSPLSPTQMTRDKNRVSFCVAEVPPSPLSPRKPDTSQLSITNTSRTQFKSSMDSFI